MTIGDSFKRFRKEYGLTQQQVATVLNIHKQAYHRYEKDVVVPAATILIKIANAYNVSVDYLVGLSDNPARLQ